MRRISRIAGQGGRMFAIVGCTEPSGPGDNARAARPVPSP